MLILYFQQINKIANIVEKRTHAGSPPLHVKVASYIEIHISYTKYVSQIDKFINRAYRNGYTKEIVLNRDKKLWLRITNDHTNALHSLLPNKLIVH